MKRKDIMVITSIAAGYNMIYNLYVMKALYYSIMIKGLNITHYQLGKLYSMYGILAMASYLCGALFLRIFPIKKLVYIPLFITAFISIFLATIPTYNYMLIMFGFAGFIIGSTFYPAHISILHNIGGLENQGKVFSTFFFMNSIFGSIFSLLGFTITSYISTSQGQIRFLFLFYGILTFISAIFSMYSLKYIEEKTENTEDNKFDLSQIKYIIKNKSLFIVILIVFSNYVAVANFTYLIPYLKYKFNLPEYILNIISIVRMYLIIIIASPIAGAITDRLQSAAKLMRISFLLYILSVVSLITISSNSPILSIAFCILICFIAYGGKSMAFITIDEANLKKQFYSIYISYISFVAYSPDVFYFSLNGWIIDNFYSNGYVIVFILAAVVAIVGLISSSILIKYKHKHQ